jgi:hypothetical protein
LHLEVFAETPHETGEREVPILLVSKALGTARTFDAAVQLAVRYADLENMGDGDFAVADADGRRVGLIAVRGGSGQLTRTEPGPTAAEALESLYERCPYCGDHRVLIPCAVCGARRCVYCMGRRACCNPHNEPTVDPT